MVSGNRQSAFYFLLFLLVIIFLIRYTIYLITPLCEIGKTYTYKLNGYEDVQVDDYGIIVSQSAVIFPKNDVKKIKYGTSLIIGSCKGYLIKNFAKKIVLEDAIISSGNTDNLKADKRDFWNDVRYKVSELILSSHSREVASIIMGFVFGMKDQLGSELYDLFKRAGISHVVVASGFNIALLASLIGGLLVFVPKNFRLLVVLLSLVPYLFIVGFEPPILRSYIMLLVSYVGWFLGRGFSGGFIGAVFLMLMIDPSLIFNLSFLLSVGATFGLIYISPLLEGLMSKISVLRFLGPLKEEMGTTLGAFVGVLPVSLLVLGNVSPWGIVVNVVVGPFVSLITVLSLFHTMLVALHIPLGGMVSIVVETLVRLWLMLVRLMVK